MSKRGGDTTRVHATKVKKRRGVGFRTIHIPDSDEEGLLPSTSDDYARVTKTRVTASGKAGKVTMRSVPIVEVEQPNTPVLPEENPDTFLDVVVEDVVPAMPAKRQKTINDSVSDPTT
jgi:hypothetical protein